MNKRIKRLRLGDPIEMKIISSKKVKDISEVGAIVYRRVYEVIIDAPNVGALVRPGYILLALLQRADMGCIRNTSDGAARMLTRLPSAKGLDLSAFLNRKPICDECGKARSRKNIFIVRCPDGSVKTYGGKCVELVIPKGSIAHVEFLCGIFDIETISDDYDEDEGGYGHVPVVSTDEVLETTALLLTFQNYISNKAAEYTDIATTSHDVTTILHGRCNEYTRSMFDAFNAAAASDNGEAEKIAKASRVWAESVNGDYGHNLRAALACVTVNRRTQGLVVSAVGCYLRDEAKKRETAVLDALPEPHHINKALKKTHDLGVGAISFIRSFEGDYGTSWLIKIVLDSGAILEWWASREQDDDIDVGARVSVRAQLKSHGLDRRTGKPVNKISRAKLTTI